MTDNIIKTINGVAGVKPAEPATAPQPVRKSGGGGAKAVEKDNASAEYTREWAEKVNRIAADVQRFLSKLDTELRIVVDDRSDDVIVRVIDPKDGAVIRQIPSKEILEIRERMEELAGILYDART